MNTAHLILTINHTNNKSTHGYSCPFASHRQFNDALPQVADNLVTSANSTNLCLDKLQPTVHNHLRIRYPEVKSFRHSSANP